MEPRIRYAKTSDGVSIAYAVFGEGPPIVHLGSFPGGAHHYSHSATSRRRIDRLVDLGWRVVRYDGRGTGSSDRDAVDFSLEARLRDLEAVVDRLGLERSPILAHRRSAFAAIAYSAQRPQRVSRLVLLTPYASGALLFATPTGRALKAMRPLLEEHWELMTLNIAYLDFRFAARELADERASAYRSGIAPDAYRALDEADEGIDVTGFLGSISAPTIVIEDTSTPYSGRMAELSSMVKKVAAAIPNSRLVTTDDFVIPTDEFLREGLPAAGREAELPSGMTAILFADIADSTALTERLGDAAFRAKARDLDAALRTVIREQAGTAIEGKLLGDGVLAVFTSARQAIEAALVCGRSGDGAGLPLHLGLHAGDVIREDNNVYGGAVNIASRIAALSAAGEVLVSETVRSLARTSAGVRFEDRGEQALKGVGEAVRVWAVKDEA